MLHLCIRFNSNFFRIKKQKLTWIKNNLEKTVYNAIQILVRCLSSIRSLCSHCSHCFHHFHPCVFSLTDDPPVELQSSDQSRWGMMIWTENEQMANWWQWKKKNWWQRIGDGESVMVERRFEQMASLGRLAIPFTEQTGFLFILTTLSSTMIKWQRCQWMSLPSSPARSHSPSPSFTPSNKIPMDKKLKFDHCF